MPNDRMPNEKIGRPTKNLKSVTIRVRVDSGTLKKLDECLGSRSDVIREGIDLVYKKWTDLENMKYDKRITKKKVKLGKSKED